MLRRILALLLLAWALGFLAFAVSLPQPAGPVHTDAAIVLTGGEGRIARGLQVVRAQWAPRLLVSGVDSDVKPGEFLAEYKVEPDLLACCITLGYRSVDTRSNARESVDWLAGRHVRSVRLITSDWHMRRAAWELRRVLPPGVVVVEDAVPSRPRLGTLISEYSKLLVRWLWRLVHLLV